MRMTKFHRIELRSPRSSRGGGVLVRGAPFSIILIIIEIIIIVLILILIISIPLYSIVCNCMQLQLFLR